MVASLALGLVLSHRTSGVVNFAHAAMGMYVAFAFFEFRETGDLVLPILGLPGRVHLLARPVLASALVFAIVLAIVLVDDPLKRTMAGALGAFQGQWGTDIPLLCAGRNVSAPTSSTVVNSKVTKRGVCVGSVPAVMAVARLAARLPARASTGIISQ